MKTGMKAPEGMGMVVATADIQNWKTIEEQHHSDEGTDGEDLKLKKHRKMNRANSSHS